MSNGLPTRRGAADPDRPDDVYARGYHTAAAKHAVKDVIGGDDFLEVLPLRDPQADRPSLYARLVGGTVAGATWLVFDMDQTHLDLYLAAGDAPP